LISRALAQALFGYPSKRPSYSTKVPNELLEYPDVEDENERLEKIFPEGF
jgi:hypothetical protein